MFMSMFETMLCYNWFLVTNVCVCGQRLSHVAIIRKNVVY
jgi:hypothetical protein